MSAPMLAVELEEIEPASELGELFKTDVLEKKAGQRPCEGTRVVVLGEDGQEDQFYVKHIKREVIDELGQKVLVEDFILVALRPTTLKTIVVDLRKKAPE